MKGNEQMGKGALILIMALIVESCLFPDNSYLMKLNRRGKWEQAEAVGREMIRNGKAFSPRETGETYYHVIYALIQQEKTGEAREMLISYDGLDDDGEEWGGWVPVAMERLRTVITEGDPFPRGKELRDLNRAGEWGRAELMALDILEGESNLLPDEYAQVLYNLAYARTRLGKTAEAGEDIRALEQFRRENPLSPELLWMVEELTSSSGP